MKEKREDFCPDKIATQQQKPILLPRANRFNWQDQKNKSIKEQNTKMSKMVSIRMLQLSMRHQSLTQSLLIYEFRLQWTLKNKKEKRSSLLDRLKPPLLIAKSQ